MAEPPGPFKIVLAELEPASADTLGNPAADKAQAELARLFNLDEHMASSIVSAVPIVILDGLSARAAGVVRERLAGLRAAGCKVTVTDESSDTIPRVNWPELPQVAHIEEEPARVVEVKAEPAPAAKVSPALLAEMRRAYEAMGRCLAELEGGDGASAERIPAPRGQQTAPRGIGATRPASSHPTGLMPSTRSTPTFPDDDDDEWMNPPVSKLSAPSRSGASDSPALSSPILADPLPDPLPEEEPVGSARFDNAALLAYHSADSAPKASLPPPPPPISEPKPFDTGFKQDLPSAGLQVTFSESDDALAMPSEVATADFSPIALDATPERGSGVLDLPPAPRLDPFELDPPPAAVSAFSPSNFDADELGSGSSFDATGSLDDSDLGSAELGDSASDILEIDPPHRRREQPQASTFEDDFDLLSDDDLPAPPARRRDPSDEFAELLESDIGPAAPASKSRSKGRRREEPDLDDVLRMFGPEDEEPLDDLEGLEPRPLDLSGSASGIRSGGSGVRSGSERRRGRSGDERSLARADPFDDEFSDILEPLNPSEAMEIIKSQRGRGGRERGREGSEGFDAFDDDESIDLFAESRTPARSSSPSYRKKGKKKTRASFSAPDEDSLFEESNRGRSPSSASGAGRKRTDPFARARRAMGDEDFDDPPSKPARSSRGGGRRGGQGGGTQGGREASSRGGRGRRGGSTKPTRSRAETTSPGRRRGGSGGPAPSGAGDHGLVLSKITDPDKKDKAAELIAEIKGCSVNEANRLTERTIIPVLKSVSREVAEFHLDKFKRFKITGRVTTRQRG